MWRRRWTLSSRRATGSSSPPRAPVTRRRPSGPRAGRAVLIEIPACDSAAGGERLAALACERGALLRGVHASRFLAPNALLGAALDAGRIGSVERVLYRRTVVPRNRTWTDDALRHHAQHPIDLLLDWLGDARPLTCVTWWRDGARVAVEAELAFGSSTLARIAVRYGADAAESSMRVEGTRGTLETDGFTWLSQDGAPPTEVWDADTTYAASIERCDALFVEAIGGRPVGRAGTRPSDWLASRTRSRRSNGVAMAERGPVEPLIRLRGAASLAGRSETDWRERQLAELSACLASRRGDARAAHAARWSAWRERADRDRRWLARERRQLRGAFGLDPVRTWRTVARDRRLRRDRRVTGTSVILERWRIRGRDGLVAAALRLAPPESDASRHPHPRSPGPGRRQAAIAMDQPTAGRRHRGAGPWPGRSLDRRPGLPPRRGQGPAARAPSSRVRDRADT